jgi:hypothetical protein
LLHIGTGNHDEIKRPIQSNCTGGFTPEWVLAQAKEAERPGVSGTTTAITSSSIGARSTGADTNTNSNGRAPVTHGPSPPYSVPIMHAFEHGASSWSTVNLTCVRDKANISGCPFDNPSGWVDSDGTAWVNFVVRGNHSTISGRGAYGFGLAKAPHWSGPYAPLSGFWDAPILSSGGDPHQNCEDSVLYRDSRGDLHMLFHYFGLGGTVRVFRQKFALDDASGSHACSLEALSGV